MKWVKYLRYLFLGISVLTLVYFIFAPSESAGAGVMLTWAYILLGLTVLVSVIFPLINLITNPKAAIRTLVGLLIVIAVLGLSYALASDEPIINSAGGFFENPFTLKLSDMGLYSAYIALAVTIVVIIAGEIRNAIK